MTTELTGERRNQSEINRLFWLLVVLVLLNVGTISQTYMVRVDLGSRTTARVEMAGELQRMSDANRKISDEQYKLLLDHIDELDRKLDAHLKSLR